MVGLGDLSGVSDAFDVSADGSVVVGTATSGTGQEATRWTSSEGMVGLGDLSGGALFAYSTAATPDASTIVGIGSSASGTEAFRWTSSGGMVGLGGLPGGIFFSTGNGVSSDGSIVVGQSFTALGSEAFRWTSADGMVGLGELPGEGFNSVAIDVSADGSTVVGIGNSSLGDEAFIWTQGDGMQILQDVLENDYGLDLTGWLLRQAFSISSDEMVIAGWGDNPNGQREAWVANLRSDIVVPPVPEPGTLALFGIGLAGIAFMRRRRAA